MPHSAAATAQPLSNDHLDYDRDAVTPGVVHIGVGGFHRAHQGVYFHELAEQGVRDWGVIGVSLRSRTVQDALEPQDLLYTVVERGAEEDTATVVGSLSGYLHAPEDPEEVHATLADPQIRLVTLTLTGDGYDVDPADESTFAAYVVEGLARRRAAGTMPFTVLSCDNVPRNGDVTREAVVAHARLRDPELAGWIEAHVAFPSSMVDRITPGTDEEAVELVEHDMHLDDSSPVTTEPFSQWIIEDVFSDGRPPLEDVGVQFVGDVAPYELMKKRMLNGTHSAIGYLGTLAGCETTNDVMEDAVLGAYVARIVEDEIMPLIPDVPGIDMGEYTETLLERLANPKIGDELTRLCRRGSTKVPAYLLPSLTEAVEQDRPHALLELAVAGWVVYLRTAEDIQDARLDELRPLAEDARAFAAEWSLAADRLADAVERIESEGARAAIEKALA